MTTETASRYIDALQTAADAVLEDLRAAREEGVRFADRLSTEVATAQRRNLGVVRRAVEQPADVAGNWLALIDAQVQAQAQAFDLSRAWFAELTSTSAQRRARIEKVWSANREALAAGIAATQEALAANPMVDLLRSNPFTDSFHAPAPAAGGASAG